MITLVLLAALAQEPKISVTQPLVATGYNTSEAFVTGKDMKIRHCPADYNLYIRVDGQKPENRAYQYVPPKTLLPPPPGNIEIKVFCIREDVH